MVKITTKLNAAERAQALEKAMAIKFKSKNGKKIAETLTSELGFDGIRAREEDSPKTVGLIFLDPEVKKKALDFLNKQNVKYEPWDIKTP